MYPVEVDPYLLPPPTSHIHSPPSTHPPHISTGNVGTYLLLYVVSRYLLYGVRNLLQPLCKVEGGEVMCEVGGRE